MAEVIELKRNGTAAPRCLQAAWGPEGATTGVLKFALSRPLTNAEGHFLHETMLRALALMPLDL